MKKTIHFKGIHKLKPNRFKDMPSLRTSISTLISLCETRAEENIVYRLAKELSINQLDFQKAVVFRDLEQQYR